MEAILCNCGHMSKPEGCTTGYGTDASGKTSCFACCAVADKARVEAGDVAGVGLYLSDDGGRVTNWPGATMLRVKSREYRACGFGGWHRMVSWHGWTDSGLRVYGRCPGRGMYTRGHVSKRRTVKVAARAAIAQAEGGAQ